MAKGSDGCGPRVPSAGGGAGEYNSAYLETGGFFRPVASEARGRGKSGPRVHCALLDEVHEHPTAAMVEFMRAGTKGRKQALILMITNSGHDRNTVCYQYHEYSRKVVQQQLPEDDTDSFFGYVCGLDEGDDWKDEAVWPKANPLLGTAIPLKYLREQVREAVGMPAKQNIVRRLNFCEWTEADAAWLPQITATVAEAHVRADADQRMVSGGLAGSRHWAPSVMPRIAKSTGTTVALVSTPPEARSTRSCRWSPGPNAADAVGATQ